MAAASDTADVLFHRCFELALEAFHSHSFPVGALIVGPDNGVEAEGRNRMGERSAPDGRLRATALAHAEMDVLAQLPLADYTGHVLYTSLEPCLLCRSAATMTHVGQVRYLAADVLCAGLDRLAEINEHTQHRYPGMTGPEAGPLAAAAGVLPLAVFLLLAPEGFAADYYRDHAGPPLDAAEQIVTDGLWPQRSEPAREVIERLAVLLE